MEVVERNGVVARNEEGGVPRAVEEGDGGEAGFDGGECDGGVTEEGAMSAEFEEVGRVE